MCGIAGLFDGGRSTAGAELEARARSMASALVHRGPDDDGVWSDAAAGIALAHRRLSVIDLSAAGHQPMTSASGRFVITYNGELYNFRSLRRELEAAGVRAWRGTSDTEVLLHAFERWGVAGAIERAVGMFALAVWDAAAHCVHLVRDRLGEKPLHWAERAGTWTFGSQADVVAAAAGDPVIDRGAVALYLRHGYVPAPRTMFDGVRKVPPGTIVTLRAGEPPVVEPYWRLTASSPQDRVLSLDGAADELEVLLGEAVAAELVADVPVGAFLSGGVDSSLIAALMTRATANVRTFSVGFHEREYDEAQHAAAVARHLGTDHTELYVSGDEALQTAKRLPATFDEPFGDSSALPMLLVAELARRDVTVALSGDGGDELFGGYDRYRRAEVAWRTLSSIPRPVRTALGRAAGRVPARRWDQLGRAVGRTPGDRVLKLAAMADATRPEMLYTHLVGHWQEPEAAVLGVREPASHLTDPSTWPPGGSTLERMMALDLGTYLPDDVLVKVDRTTMAASLEARAPLLDHRVVEWARRLPMELHVDGRDRKRVLRHLLHRYVPQELVDRPKMGFTVPMAAWLRGPLRSWAAELLSRDRLAEQGIFDPDVIARRWDEHQDGSRQWSYALWDVVAFQAWCEARSPVVKVP